MSIQFMDDFQGYGTGSDPSAMLDGTPWIATQGCTILADPDPNVTGICLRAGSSGGTTGGSTRLSVLTPGIEIGIAFRMWLDNLPTASVNAPGVTFRDIFNGGKYQLRVEPSGAVSLIRESTPATLATTASPIIFAGSWNHIEFRVNTSTGVIEVYKEGAVVSDLSITDESPATGNIGIVSFYQYSSGGNNSTSMKIKDMILTDGTGSQNTGQIGTCSVFRLNPSADVSSGWTPSTGSTFYDLLDKPSASNDTTYISADDSPPAATVLEFEDLPADIVGVRALMPYVRMRKSDAGDATVQMTLTSNGSDDAGADRTVTTAFSYYFDISELDPDTGTAWSPTSVNDATITLDRTA